jgi:hypothetical protein
VLTLRRDRKVNVESSKERTPLHARRQDHGAHRAHDKLDLGDAELAAVIGHDLARIA